MSELAPPASPNPASDSSPESIHNTETGLPSGIKYIIGNEAAERFSFYGMKAILAVFMTKYLLDSHGQPAHMSPEEANVWIHRFIKWAYFFPIVGAVLSDWVVGKYRMILYLSLLYCFGHFTLALIDFKGTSIEPRTFLFYGLVLITIGAGGIKPCVSSNVGDQFGPQNKHWLPFVFSIFYFSINFGSFFSTLLTPKLLEYYGPGIAFGVPGILMAIATLVFWLGSPYYIKIPPSGNRFFTETFSRDGLRAIFNLIPLYLFIAMFWALFDQTASAWVHQADRMNRKVLGYEILPAQLMAANPLFVMILIPFFTFVIYPTLGKYFTLTPLRKIGIGLMLTVPAFLIPGFVEMQLDNGVTMHIMWQILAYVLITSAEVLVSITALEFSYTQSPPRMKSFIMGLYLLSVALGNLFTEKINKWIIEYKEQGVSFLEGANYYWFFSGAMFCTALIYIVWSVFYKGRTYIQGDDPEIV